MALCMVFTDFRNVDQYGGLTVYVLWGQVWAYGRGVIPGVD